MSAETVRKRVGAISLLIGAVTFCGSMLSVSAVPERGSSGMSDATMVYLIWMLLSGAVKVVQIFGCRFILINVGAIFCWSLLLGMILGRVGVPRSTGLETPWILGVLEVVWVLGWLLVDAGDMAWQIWERTKS